jgi:hypothetical protein
MLQAGADIFACKRKRGSNEMIAGSSVGVSHVKGVVSALEFHRFHHQHEYPHDSAAQISLRSDSRITAFEKAVQHNEPKRADDAQVLKVAGSSSGACPPLTQCV